MWSRRASGAKLQDNFRKLSVTFKECFQVVTTAGTPIIDVYTAIDPVTGIRIPMKAELYPGTNTIYAVEVNPTQVSPIMFLVEAGYAGEVGPLGPEDNPLNTPPSIDFDDIETEEEIDEDFDGYPIINANYEPIEGVKAAIPDLVLNVQRNFATYSTYQQGIYRRATNSDNFNGWPPGTARLIKFKAKNVFDQYLGYWQVSASIRFRYPYRTTSDKAWYARVRHEGFYERLVAGGPIVRACDGYKHPVTKKILLKANGTRETDPNNTHWLEIKKYDSLPFAALGLL